MLTFLQMDKKQATRDSMSSNSLLPLTAEYEFVSASRAPKCKPFLVERDACLSLGQLELIALNPSEQPRKIEQHLKKCSVCLGFLKRFQAQIEHPDEAELYGLVKGTLPGLQLRQGKHAVIQSHVNKCRFCFQRLREKKTAYSNDADSSGRASPSFCV